MSILLCSQTACSVAIVLVPPMDFLIDVANAVLEASGLKEKVARSEQVIRLKQRFGLEDIESLTKFEDVYAYALVEYAFDEEGRCKHPLLVEFFKAKAVRDVFRVAYRDNDPAGWLGKGQAIAQYELGDKLPVGIDPKRELSTFAAAFIEIVNGTRSPKEIRQEQKIDSLQRQLQSVQAQIQQLPSLEAINQTVSQLAGGEVRSLPSAAQESNAADLAHRLGEWFEVLEYDRVADYEVWAQDYFEWAIDFPVTRRRVSRTLVRGVAGVVEMADLQDFAKAIEAAGADEGWLVGNRRVSKAARQAATDETAYEEISCYTFDELIDEDADFSKYLDWLEADIRQRGVDVGYLPLACRKDELDAVSQRKIGVSTYGEEDGWIDGYVDMWLDDPAKEHLSVLGEFGTGKTWFALHYAWVALQRYRDAKRRGIERPRVPIVVPLRDYAKAVSVESLFSEFFFRKHEILKNYSVFEQLNRMGKLLLIFDGFDEMAARVDRQAMIDNFWELARVVVPGAKAVLTCRTEHFPDAIQGRQLLSAELESSTAKLTGETPQFEVLELEKFEDEQIAALLGQQASERTVRVVMENSQLLDLARRPVMVELILEALPDIEAGKPVDMARVYLYAVTKKMERDISNERTFTSLADKLYFLCELSWEMLSTDQMSLNYRAFPERLKEMFADRMKDEKELDHWRYDMMGQTMLIRNSEGDYSPAHRSLLEFFVAYKIVASLGAMAEDFTELSREQIDIDLDLAPKNYTWDGYFKRMLCNNTDSKKSVAPMKQFEISDIKYLFSLLGTSKLAKAVLELACPMLMHDIREHLLPLIWDTRSRSVQNVGYFAGNIIQLMLEKNPRILMGSDLRETKLRGIDFTEASLQKVNFKKASLIESSFPKVIGNINDIDFNPDGTHIAIADSNYVLQIWNVITGQVVLFCSGHAGSIRSVSFSPDGTVFASGSSDKTVKLWSMASGECMNTLQGHCDRIRSVAFSPVGTKLASAGDDGTIRLWSADTGKCLYVLEEHQGSVKSVAFSLDGKVLASGGSDKKITIWLVASGECLFTLAGHTEQVSSVAFSPDGRTLASASADTTLRFWQLEGGKCLRVLKGHNSGIRSVAFSPNGKTLASSGDDKMVRLWSTNEGQCISTLEGHENWVRSVVFSPDGKILASGGDGKKVRLWSADSGVCLNSLGYQYLVRSVVFSPDGKTLASGSDDRTVKIWSITNSRKCLRVLEGHDGWIRSVVFNPDGTLIASASDDRTVKLWSLASGECIRTLRGHQDWVRSVAFSPENMTLASASDDKTIKLWTAVDGECISSFEGHEDKVWAVAYSPNGQLLVSGSNDRTVKVWSVNSGECLQTFRGHQDWVRSAVFSPDGQTVISAGNDDVLKLWSTDNGECIHTLRGHRNVIRSVAVSPSGEHIVSGSNDNTIKLWSTSTGECIYTFEGHEGVVRSVAYSPDGRNLATSSSDETIRLWNIESKECTLIADERVCAEMTITDTLGLTSGQRTALKLMGAVDHGEE
ncbi:MAG: NACHT domain-containing protein [Cyanobacteria bacterium J06581_3]